MSVCACCLLFFSLALLRRKFNLLDSPHQKFTQNDEISSCFLQAAQLHLSHPLLVWQMLQSLHYLCDPVQDLLQQVHVSPGAESPWMYTASLMCLTRAEQMGGITSSNLLAMLCLKQEFFLDEEDWKGAGWVSFLINAFKVRKKWKAARWILFWASRFSQRMCSLKYYTVCRYYGSFIK